MLSQTLRIVIMFHLKSGGVARIGAVGSSSDTFVPHPSQLQVAELLRPCLVLPLRGSRERSIQHEIQLGHFQTRWWLLNCTFLSCCPSASSLLGR